jgi:hypothetical protein
MHSVCFFQRRLKYLSRYLIRIATRSGISAISFLIAFTFISSGCKNGKMKIGVLTEAIMQATGILP